LYAQGYHLGSQRRENLTQTVRAWREIELAGTPFDVIPLPHPSWRNTAWMKRNPWFEAELVPELRARIRALLGRD
ncbi:MAG TPA: uracil-DNA glycosylase family protein, partial [Hyphomicrobiales bacterium]|nr:uracil-DNA glycosylase family protein [Hyphomicrobiales bacterium]